MGCGAPSKRYEGDGKTNQEAVVGSKTATAPDTAAAGQSQPDASKQVNVVSSGTGTISGEAVALGRDAKKPLGRAGGAVIFDCDGTLLDTEKLRSEVTFLLLAPYMPGLETWPGTFQDWKEKYIMKAAGRSFKQKGEDVDTERSAAGLRCIAECWASGLKDTAPVVAKAVLAARGALGLPEEPSGHPGLQEAKWAEDDIVLKTCSQPCAGMPQVVAGLQAGAILFNIASTSSQDSLKASVIAAGLADAFKPEDKMIHSGESDFDPPAHKPKPDVYLKAAAALGVNPKDCIAVEDSDSGVGAAAHAGMGFIVGYVGGGQIPASMREEAAGILLAGGRTKDNRGADIVISDALGLLPLVSAWQSDTLCLPLAAAPDCGDGVQVWLPNSLTHEAEEEAAALPQLQKIKSAKFLRQQTSTCELP